MKSTEIKSQSEPPLLGLQSLGWSWAFERWTHFDYFNHRRYGQLTCRRARSGVSDSSVLFLPNCRRTKPFMTYLQCFEIILWAFELQIVYYHGT